MSDKRVSVDSECAGSLNGIGQLQTQSGSEAGGIRGQSRGKIDDMPRLQDRSIAFSQLLVAGLKWACEYLGNANRGHGEVQIAGGVPFEQGREYLGELRMLLQVIDYRCRIHQHE